MAYIKFLKNTVNYEKVISKYNENKPVDWPAIRKAGVYEGGFEIPLLNEEYNGACDENECVKQMRWSNGLLYHFGYRGFNEYETKLLFDALVQVYGFDTVKMVNSQKVVNNTRYEWIIPARQPQPANRNNCMEPMPIN
jgi:hypothetical protein